MGVWKYVPTRPPLLWGLKLKIHAYWTTPLSWGSENTTIRAPRVFFSLKKFQVIYRFCQGQNGHSPGLCVEIFGAKRWTLKNVLTFQVLSRFFTVKMSCFSRFSHLSEANSMLFLDLDRSNSISRFSRFQMRTVKHVGPPLCCGCLDVHTRMR